MWKGLTFLLPFLFFGHVSMIQYKAAADQSWEVNKSLYLSIFKRYLHFSWVFHLCYFDFPQEI